MMGIITEKEIATARRCLDHIMRCGASGVRISLSKGMQSSICTLDGKVDKILSSTDRSLLFQIFANGSYGTFSTNMLESSDMDSFLHRAVDTVRILAPDPCYGLPDPSLKAKGAISGDEMGLVDEAFFELGPQEKIALALESNDGGALSEEGEYSDSFDDNFVIDSDGFEGRAMETSFNYTSGITLEGPDNAKYTGYWWDSRTFFKDFAPRGISAEAVRQARAKFNPAGISSGKYDIVVDRCCASKLLRPVISALSGYSVHQHNSFLEGKLGQPVFCPNLTVTDRPAIKGMGGSRLFDSEGVALRERPIIENGVLKTYFINTYMSRKLGMDPTTEAVTRPMFEPWICNSVKKEISLNDLLECIGNGLYITGFNGGNCNSSTGNFSFGVEGFTVANGKVAKPFSEALLTGNMLGIWNSLLGAACDTRECQMWKVPSLAFSQIDINA